MPDRRLQHGGICFAIVEGKSTRYTALRTPVTTAK
jgi:hypothetical protein